MIGIASLLSLHFPVRRPFLSIYFLILSVKIKRGNLGGAHHPPFVRATGTIVRRSISIWLLHEMCKKGPTVKGFGGRWWSARAKMEVLAKDSEPWKVAIQHQGGRRNGESISALIATRGKSVAACLDWTQRGLW